MLPAHEKKRTEELKFSRTLKRHIYNQVEEVISISGAHDSFFKSGSSQHSHVCMREWTELEEPNPENTLKGECKYNKS